MTQGWYFHAWSLATIILLVIEDDPVGLAFFISLAICNAVIACSGNLRATLEKRLSKMGPACAALMALGPACMLVGRLVGSSVPAWRLAECVTLVLAGIGCTLEGLRLALLRVKGTRNQAFSLALRACRTGCVIAAVTALLPADAVLTVMTLLPLAGPLGLGSSKNSPAATPKREPEDSERQFRHTYPLAAAGVFYAFATVIACWVLGGSALASPAWPARMGGVAMLLVLACICQSGIRVVTAHGHLLSEMASLVIYVFTSASLVAVVLGARSLVTMSVALLAACFTEVFNWVGIVNQCYFGRLDRPCTISWNRLVIALGVAGGIIARQVLGEPDAMVALVAVALLGCALGVHLSLREPYATKTLSTSGAVYRDVEDIDNVAGRCASLGGQKGLTAREIDVITLVARGLPRSLIAERLGISENTVRGHVYAAYGKLGIHTRAELQDLLGLGDAHEEQEGAGSRSASKN